MAHTIHTRKYKGVMFSLQVSDVFGCCGTRQVHSFRVDGRDELTPEERTQMFRELGHRLKDTAMRHIFAADSLVPDAWSNGGGSSRTNLSSVGAFMLEIGAKQLVEFKSRANGNQLGAFFLDADDLRSLPQPVFSDTVNLAGGSVDALVKSLLEEIVESTRGAT